MMVGSHGATMAAMRSDRGPGSWGGWTTRLSHAPSGGTWLRFRHSRIRRTGVVRGRRGCGRGTLGQEGSVDLRALGMVAFEDTGRSGLSIPCSLGRRAEQIPSDAARTGRPESVQCGCRRPQSSPRRGERRTDPHLECPALVSPDRCASDVNVRGWLMMHLDEVASLLALRFCRCPIVTASIDALAFFAPIRVGGNCRLHADYVGRTVDGIGVRDLAENPSRAYAAIRAPLPQMVHVDATAAPAVPTITIPRRKQTTPLGRPRSVGGAPGPPALAPARG